MFGVVGGTVLGASDLVKGAPKKARTPYGLVEYFKTPRFVLIPRHGLREKVPAHKVNHHANAFALKKLGVDFVVGVCSAGSLKAKIRPSTVAVPKDYMTFSPIPTFHDRRAVHATADLDEVVRSILVAAARKAGVVVLDGGVYAQTSGPRFETKAEVVFLSGFADYVGMTLASEATLCAEAGLRYAALCSIDNFANGVSEVKPDFVAVKANAASNAANIEKILSAVESK